jgi:ketosteroid isomerase-like protein
MKPAQESYTLDWQPQHVTVSAAGDLGYTWGSYTVMPKSGPGDISHGKYLNVWQKEENGQWRVLVDMGNDNPEPTDKQRRSE